MQIKIAASCDLICMYPGFKNGRTSMEERKNFNGRMEELQSGG
jgi:hypothetical protein